LLKQLLSVASPFLVGIVLLLLLAAGGVVASVR
jgi:hypothetical protein